MNHDLYYSERHFSSSFTYGKWVPMFCADIVHLRPFQEIYKRPPKDGFEIPKSNGPFFFRNHPIDYVTVVGRIQNAMVIDIEGSKANVVLVIHCK